MSADPEKAMEVVDNDHESLDEDEEDGDKMEVSFQICWFRSSFPLQNDKLSCPILNFKSFTYSGF